MGIAGHFLETLGSLVRCFLDESNFEILRILSLECIMKPLLYCCLGESFVNPTIFCSVWRSEKFVLRCFIMLVKSFGFWKGIYCTSKRHLAAVFCPQ